QGTGGAGDGRGQLRGPHGARCARGGRCRVVQAVLQQVSRVPGDDPVGASPNGGRAGRTRGADAGRRFGSVAANASLVASAASEGTESMTSSLLVAGAGRISARL